MTTKNTLAVVSQTGESLSFFNTTTGTKTGHLSDLIAEPHELCLDRKRNVLYITHAYRHGWYGSHGDDGHEISVFDCEHREVVDVIDILPAKGPHYALLDEANHILYACVEGGLEGDKLNAGGIIAIDLKIRKVIKSIPSGYKSHWFVTTPDFRKTYCCNKDGGFISVIDLQKMELVKKISAPDGNEQPSISRDGKWAYFPSPTLTVGMQEGFKDYSILVIDTTTDEIVHRIPMDQQMLTTHVTASNLLLVGQHLPSPADGRLLILSSHEEGYKQLGSVPVGCGPLTVISDDEGKMAFVAGIFAGTVTVVDLNLEALRVVRTLEVDAVKREDKAMLCGAHGMAIVS